MLDVGDHLAARAIELDAWAEGLADDGIPFHLVPDAAEAARVLAALGLLADGTVDRVRAAMSDEA